VSEAHPFFKYSHYGNHPYMPVRLPSGVHPFWSGAGKIETGGPAPAWERQHRRNQREDCGKGYLAVWIAGQLLEAQWAVAVAGLMAFLGHVFSIFLKFKGGKGVATGLGVFLCLMPWAGLSSMGVFAVTLVLTRYVSASSILAAISIPWLGYYFDAPGPSLYVATAAAIITTLRHRENIQRLVDGTESKFFKK
jgi:glycerol-3-phosphate acyltransferase PlsY